MEWMRHSHPRKKLDSNRPRGGSHASLSGTDTTVGSSRRAPMRSRERASSRTCVLYGRQRAGGWRGRWCTSVIGRRRARDSAGIRDPCEALRNRRRGQWDRGSDEWPARRHWHPQPALSSSELSISSNDPNEFWRPQKVGWPHIAREKTRNNRRRKEAAACRRGQRTLAVAAPSRSPQNREIG